MRGDAAGRREAARPPGVRNRAVATRFDELAVFEATVLIAVINEWL
ncbi:hypothetical protein STHAL_15730 [Streptomyces halstedii]|uniref:Transposase n=1 Tax=Streptomyces halstedii TaxID=1944 RepID=A0ABS6TRL2_STRHA|nr:hypothetical protein [Streptomyces halstedii]MBV7670912.1 hypothetical protein [Streptomyces halstedii]